METDDLYGLPLDEFVPQRAAIAKALRADKRRDEAAQVAGLRKPSIAAWAVNQLVRTQHESVQALFEAGDGLRGAQEDLLAGSGDGRKLRAAGEREREAVDKLVEAARGLLTSGGYELSAAVVERVDETLHAAALNEEAREQVRDGRLERELRHVGLGLGSGEALAATPAPRAPKDSAPAKGPARAKGSALGTEPARARGSARRTEPAPARGSAGSKSGAGRSSSSSRSAGKGSDAGRSGADGAGTDAEAERAAAERAAEEERAVADERAAAQERAEAERAKCERAAARKSARAAETAARRRADAAARALEKAERRRETAAQALGEADDALASAREDADDATAEHERAQAALDEL